MSENKKPEVFRRKTKINVPLCFGAIGKIEAFFFLLNFALGILAAWKMKKFFDNEDFSLKTISFGEFFFSFLVALLFVLWVVYFVKSPKGKRIFFKTIFLFSVIFGGLSFFNLWLGPFLSLFLVFLLAFLWLKKRTVWLHNLFLTFALAGVAARLGLDLSPQVVILAMLLFSFYDYVAVYKTKHMVKIAEEMIADEAIFGIVIPQKISDFKVDLKTLQLTRHRFLVVGAGDIAFPLLLAVSFVPAGLFHSIISTLFSFVGFSSGSFIFSRQKERKPMPGLPPIAFFSFLGYLVIKLVF